jgi:cytochrome c-type biogenesis protein CcsB
MSAQRLITLMWCSLVAFACAASAKDDFGARLALVKEARLSDAFAEVAVKAERPMPWPAFVKLRYEELKGGGKVAEGDLARDRDAAIWLAVLDDDYRATGRLLFVEGGKLPGIPADRWISLRAYEEEILPALMRAPGALDDEKTKKEVSKLVARAGALHGLAWSELRLTPGPAEEGWKTLGPGRPGWKYAEALTRAFERGDAAAMNDAAGALARELAAQPGYPAAAKLKLEIYLEKFGVLKIGFFLYILSSLLFFVWAALGRRPLATAGAWAAFAGFVFVTLGLAGRSIVAGYLPTTGMYEYLALFSWASVLFFLIFYVRTRQAFLGTIVMPVAFLLIVLASLFPSTIEGQLIPALQSWWLTIHVTLACLGEGAFAVGFAAAVLYLFRGDKPSKYLPSKDALDVLEYRAIAVGFPLFTIGALVAGAIWAQKAWSVWWSWDPKETASLVVFLIAVAYLHARHVAGWRGKRSAILAALIFVASVLTLFANLIFGGLHSYGV